MTMKQNSSQFPSELTGEQLRLISQTLKAEGQHLRDKSRLLHLESEDLKRNCYALLKRSYHLQRTREHTRAEHILLMQEPC